MSAKPEFHDFCSFALRGLKFPFAGSRGRRVYQHRVPTNGLLNFSTSTHRHCEFHRTSEVHALRQVRIRSCALSTTLPSAPVCAPTAVGPRKQVADNTAAAMNGVAFSMTNGTLRPVSVLSLFPV